MIKKVSLFIDRTVQQELASTSKCDAQYRAALKLFGKFVAVATTGRTDYLAIRDEGHTSSHDKYVCGCHGESKDVEKLSREANRLEACITGRHGYGSLSLEFRAYRAGSKDAFYEFSFTFDKDGSSASCSSGGCPTLILREILAKRSK